MSADTPGMTRRPFYVLFAALFVALAASACLPAAEPAATPAPALAPQATIGHCPVEGFTYGQGFGPLPSGGFHYGVDMAAPEGTPVYAVRAGTLWYWSTGDVGGYSVYLKADDGNTYYYTHLTAYPAYLENTQHTVSQGDVIETVN